MQHLSNILSLTSLRMEQCRFSPVDPAESGEITRSEVEKKAGWEWEMLQVKFEPSFPTQAP